MPRPVVLVPHDPAWAARAEGLVAELDAAVPGVFGAVHHMGSTAIPGVAAKPVIDLLAEVEALAALEGARGALAGLGWRWRGENGLAGRRYFTRDDPETGTRAAHLHVYARGDPAIAWHLAFRGRLCAGKGPLRRPPPRRQRGLCGVQTGLDGRGGGGGVMILFASREKGQREAGDGGASVREHPYGTAFPCDGMRAVPVLGGQA